MRKILLVIAVAALVLPSVPASAQGGFGGFLAFLQGLFNPRPDPAPTPPPTGRPGFDLSEQIRQTIFAFRGISPQQRRPVRGR